MKPSDCQTDFYSMSPTSRIMTANTETHSKIYPCQLRRPDSFVEIALEDDGPGIAADVLPRIFDMYFGSSAPARGPGIGLSIVKELTEAQGGVVSVRSEEGKGSRFSVFLPSAG